MDNDPRIVPWPINGWDEIIPNLYQGGQIKAGYSYRDQHVKVTGEFDAVYSFFWGDDGNGPDPEVPHVHYKIPDGSLTPEELTMVKGLAASVALRVKNGDKTLVRCQAGYNRSGLVVGFALMELGYTADDAIALIRAKRSKWALSNSYFVGYLLGGQA